MEYENRLSFSDPLFSFILKKQLTCKIVFKYNTHPIQTAQVFDFMFICVWLIVDDGVLFVHTARLNHENPVNHCNPR